jgi:D-alanyl-D-alanine endopeptidase (penicillin-binding protein 7)
LFAKELPVNKSRLFSLARVVCAVAILGFIGLPAESATGTSRTRSSVERTPDNQKLTLKKKKVTTTRTTAARTTSARTTAARATASLKARQLKEAQQPHFKFDDSGALVPDIRAEAAIIYDPKTGQVLWEQNSTDQRSIASITKVMTATVVLEDPNVDLTTPIVVDRSDVRAASTTYLRAGYQVTRDDLLHLLLIGSDNAAARALARTSPMGTEGFVRRMNEKAAELGLQTTSYADPSGLLNANVSSAYDLARLISYVSGNERIASIMRTPTYTVHAGRTTINVSSTNQLVRVGDVDVQAGKTGFISKAGYCLATLLRLPQGGPQVAVVVLGAKSNPGRFWETRHLFNWISTKTQDWFGQTSETSPSQSTAQVPAAIPAAAN